jgi:hypothetical protein
MPQLGFSDNSLPLTVRRLNKNRTFHPVYSCPLLR